ncbi:MAG: response regulator transcription factor [Sphingomonadales bacterium]|nr:MAG: response regulator transcription factor [Sphingomonadales bacterium]
MTVAALDDPMEAFRTLLVGRAALLLEDEPSVSAHIEHALKAIGFARVDCVTTGEEAVEHALTNTYDILILDRMTPSLDGLSALSQIRARDGGAAVPALFLTALGSERHRIEGLASGGDDYLVKPVSDEELLARVAVLLRRRNWRPDPGETVTVGQIAISKGALRATLAGAPIDLTAREFAILALLADNAGLPVTRSMLWSRCWSNYNFQPGNFGNTIDVHISRLRRKLEAAGEAAGVNVSDLIVAVRTQGIMLRSIAP